MVNIKYHQNGTGCEYGADHMLTNNWDSNLNYGNEYSNVFFEINALGYRYPSYNFAEGEKKAFYDDVRSALEPLGWHMENGSKSWNCDTIVNGKSYLYLHPQSFSGDVLKNHIKEIAEALQNHKTFSLKWVNLYETVYDIPDNEYEEYLNSKDDEIRRSLFEKCKTTRTTKFYYASEVCLRIADRFQLKRIGIGNRQTVAHIRKIMDCMIAEGLLIGADRDGGKLVRSPNKTEQKKSHINLS